MMTAIHVTKAAKGLMEVFVCALIFLFSAPLFAEVKTIRGNATVIDGDTLRVKGFKIRLEGVDALEYQQSCRGGNINVHKQPIKQALNWSCGKSAMKELTRIIGNEKVLCFWNHKDQYDRIVATCVLENTGSSINRLIVRNGWALSYDRFTTAYVPDQEAAKREKLGIWKSEFENPLVWRKKHF